MRIIWGTADKRQTVIAIVFVYTCLSEPIAFLACTGKHRGVYNHYSMILSHASLEHQKVEVI